MLKSLPKKLLRRAGIGWHKGPVVPLAELLNVMELAVGALYPGEGDVPCMQIGANDCPSNDPFIPLIKPHWTTILVEPQPHVADRLEASYADRENVKIERSLVAAEPGEQSLFYIKDMTDLNPTLEGVASMSRAHVARYVGGDEGNVGELRVPAVTFDQLLAKHGIDRLEILAIDVEGFDYEILKMIDFGRVKPGIVLYEHEHLSYDDAEAALQLLAANGYQMIRVGFDILAVDKSRLDNPFESMPGHTEPKRSPQ